MEVKLFLGRPIFNLRIWWLCVRPAPGALLFVMPNHPINLQLIRMLSERLERISADSVWAHRASGVRGRLVRELEKIETNRYIPAEETYKLIDASFYILEKAVREKMGPDRKSLGNEKNSSILS